MSERKNIKMENFQTENVRTEKCQDGKTEI